MSSKVVTGKKVVPITKESMGMAVASGRKKWIMRGIENAGHDGNFEVLSRHPPRFFPHAVFPFFPSLFLWRENERKSVRNVRDIQHVYCVGILRDVVSWWITYFAHFYRRTELVSKTCIHSTVDGRNTLPCWITSIYPHKRSINLYIDGFDGSFYVRRPHTRRFDGKKFQTKRLTFNVVFNLYF